MSGRRWASGLVLVLLTACASTVPSNKGIDLEDYVADVCGSLQDFSAETDSLGSAYASDLATMSRVPPWRKRLVQYLDDLIQVGDQLIKDIEAAGVPDAESGQQFTEDFLLALEQAAAAVEDARDRVKASSTGDALVFQALVENVRDATRGSFDAIQLAIGKGPPQIEEAWSNSACGSL